VVVDASGQSGLLMNTLGLRVWDPVLNKGAIWTYYRGMRRGGGHDPGATMVIQTANRKGWFWLIPLHDDVTSLGVVAPFDYLFDRQSSHEETYMAELAACPAVNERLTEAERIGEFKATRDYSYRCTEVAGDGWVLVGDAYGFLDPLYSSGVLLAFKSGELAADAVNDGLARGDTSGHQLGRWRDMFNQGVDRMRRLVCEYYDGFSFGKFVRRYPHLKGRVTDLLIGDLFTNQVDDVWPAMESMYPPGKTPPPRWDDPPSETSGASPQKPAPPQRIS
jgi:flavin-dependent dehydrogenase